MCRKILIPLFIVIITFTSFTYSDQFAPVGTSVAQFLEIGISASATGMGEAYTVMANDASAVFWNPAGLADVKSNNLFSSYTLWPAGISIGGLSFARHFQRFGTIGISSVYLMTDDMEITTIDQPEGTGDFFNITNYALGLTYSRYLTDKVSFGITTKLVHEEYYDYGYYTVALDLGTLYRTGFHGLKLGMSILHFAPEIQFEGDYVDYSDPLSYAADPEPKPKTFEVYSLPINFRFGMAMDILNINIHRLTVAGDMIHPNNSIEQYNAGFEYGFNEMIYLRSGYKFSADEGGFSFGAGAKLNISSNFGIIVNYSFADMGVLNGVNRFSLKLAF